MVWYVPRRSISITVRKALAERVEMGARLKISKETAVKMK